MLDIPVFLSDMSLEIPLTLFSNRWRWRRRTGRSWKTCQNTEIDGKKERSNGYILVGVGVGPSRRQSGRRRIPVGVISGASEDVGELVQHSRRLALLATTGRNSTQLPEDGARGHAAGRGLGVGDGVGRADAEEVDARVGAGPGGGGRGLGGEGPEAGGDVAAGGGRRGAEVLVELGRRTAGGGAGRARRQALGGGHGVAQGGQLGAGA